MRKLTNTLNRWMSRRHRNQERHPFASLQDYVNTVINPTVDAEDENLIKTVQESVQPPVFWLLGKTQSGKSAIIRTLTHSSVAEVGNGFKPCTKTAMLYDFPDAETAFLRFLDTRGLSEAGYDADEDMKWCERQAHLLIVVIKAMDHQQDTLLRAVRQIHKTHPNWPLIVAQTTLHESYPHREMGHPSPYPFTDGQIGQAVPPDLRRSLLKQREYFTGMNAHFVPIDFTLAEDGYEPSDYGVDELWSAIEKVFPLGLREMLDISKINDVYLKAAHSHIISYSILAGCASAIPVPVASLSSVVILQAKMFHSIASIYGLPLTGQSIRDIVSAVGLGVVSGMGGRELLKLIPFYGQTVAAGMAGVYTAAVSYALGKTLCFYFGQTKKGKALSPEALDERFKKEFVQGRELLRGSIKRNHEMHS